MRFFFTKNATKIQKQFEILDFYVNYFYHCLVFVYPQTIENDMNPES